MPTIFPCAFSQWAPGIGDPNAAAWLIVTLYLVAAYACASAARRDDGLSQVQGRERVFWWICAAALTLLAINKQLDLQSLLTSVARCVAQYQDWYDERRAVQRQFVLLVLAVGPLVVAATSVLLRKTFARTGLAVVGLGFVCTFIIIRAASFHHLDIVMDRAVLGLPIAIALEVPGPILILVAAVRSRLL